MDFQDDLIVLFETFKLVTCSSASSTSWVPGSSRTAVVLSGCAEACGAGVARVRMANAGQEQQQPARKRHSEGVRSGAGVGAAVVVVLVAVDPVLVDVGVLWEWVLTSSIQTRGPSMAGGGVTPES
jgi:hypothetical protein